MVLLPLLSNTKSLTDGTDMANSNGTAVAAFAAVAMGVWLIDSGIQGRHPITALEDIIKNPSNVQGSLASSKGQYATVSSLLSGSGVSAGEGSSSSSVVQAALNKGAATTTNVVNACLAFVAGVYGKTSNYSSAAQAWDDIPKQYEHPGSGDAPAGAWEFLSDSNPDGHVVLSEGNGIYESTDFSNGQYSPGKTGFGTLDQIESAFGATPLGWADPYARGIGLLAGVL